MERRDMKVCPKCGEEIPHGAACPFCPPPDGEDVVSELIKAIRMTIGRLSQN
jgi:hypothetical protein